MTAERITRRRSFSIFAAALPAALRAAPNHLPAAQVERFLSDASVVSSASLSIGLTGTRRLTLSDGALTHDAHFQSIDIARSRVETPAGEEYGFRDTYKFNIAAYRLDRMLALNMTPPSVERTIHGQTGAVTWWIPGGLMEVDRLRRKIKPPDLEYFDLQIHQMIVFDQLIFNADRNLENLLLTRDGRIWLIDHSRGFRRREELRNPKALQRCEKGLMAALQRLDNAQLQAAADGLLLPGERDALLKRRDRIVGIFEKKAASEGASRIYYVLPPRAAEYPVEAIGGPWPN